MSHEVVLTRSASRDLAGIYEYIESREGRATADDVLEAFERAFESLSTLPHRGTVPNELEDVGVVDFGEIFFKPYRIIYEVTDALVVVHLIADGRRDMRTLLERRLLG